MYESLFTPIAIGDMVLKNRLYMLAMHTGYANKKKMTEKEFAFYKARAKGGISAITTVAAVNEVAGPPNMQFLDKDENIEEFERLANMFHKYDCKLIVQLFHAGRNNLPSMIGNNKPVAPSDVPSPIYKSKVHVMTEEDIDNTINDFAQAALRAKKAGVDAVEISCSVGYLLTQFISPLTNLRKDSYGGSKENRLRFPIEVVKAIRESVGEKYPVILRISAADMMGGYDISLMKELVQELEPLIQAVNVTGGWHEAPVPQMTRHVPHGGYSFLSRAIKEAIDIPIIASNRINDPKISCKIIENKEADIIGVGRQMLTDAQYPNKIKDDKLYRKCQACNQGCIERVLKMKEAKCVFNPQTGREYEEIVKDKESKDVILIGGGPAGMEAARLSALKGHRVTLFEETDHLGGKVVLASKPPHKETFMNYIEVCDEELRELDVDIRLNTKMTNDLLSELKPDHVYLANGATPIIPPVKGIDGSNVITAEEVLLSSDERLNQLVEKDILIIGGGIVGLEIAEMLMSYMLPEVYNSDFRVKYISNKLYKDLDINLEADGIKIQKTEYDKLPTIRVVEMMPKMGKGLGGYKWIMLKELKSMGVELETSTKVIEINNNEVILETKEGLNKVNADTIILAAGYKAKECELEKYMKDNNIAYDCIGDKNNVSNILNAHEDAYNAVIN